MTTPYPAAWYASVIAIGLIGLMLVVCTGPDAIFPISGLAMALAAAFGAGVGLLGVVAHDLLKGKS